MASALGLGQCSMAEQKRSSATHPNNTQRWYCAQCGAEHANMAKQQCRICGCQRVAPRMPLAGKFGGERQQTPPWASYASVAMQRKVAPAMQTARKQTKELLATVRQQLIEEQRPHAPQPAAGDTRGNSMGGATPATTTQITSNAKTSSDSSGMTADNKSTRMTDLLQELSALGTKGEHMEALRQQALQQQPAQANASKAFMRAELSTQASR